MLFYLRNVTPYKIEIHFPGLLFANSSQLKRFSGDWDKGFTYCKGADA